MCCLHPRYHLYCLPLKQGDFSTYSGGKHLFIYLLLYIYKRRKPSSFPKATFYKGDVVFCNKRKALQRAQYHQQIMDRVANQTQQLKNTASRCGFSIL